MNKYYDKFEQQEIHLMGCYVGVVWDLVQKSEYEEQIDEDGTLREITTTRLVRSGKPRIEFPNMREASGNEGYYRDEDDTISFGVTMENAPKIAEELIAATKYVNEAQYTPEFNMKDMKKQHGR